MSVKSDVAAVRAALLPAIARDTHRPRQRGPKLGAAVIVTLALGSTGVAAATGVIWSPPKVPNDIPASPEWQYYSTNPFGHGDGPVLMRERPEATARLNREWEAALSAKGITASCGVETAHPLACYTPNGDLTPIPTGMTIDLGATDYDVKELSDAEAHTWLCEHPTQRPGADGGERPAPEMHCDIHPDGRRSGTR
jgi:hypothetical protein